MYPMQQVLPKYVVCRHTDQIQFGPYDQQTILNFVQNGTLSERDLVWNPDMPNWVMIGTLMKEHSMIAQTQAADQKGSPIHIQTAMVVMALDGVWQVLEVPGYVMAFVPGLILSFIIGVITYYVTKSIQMKTAGDSEDEAHSKALTMAVLCGVPFPFLGTIVGGYFLIWAGLKGSRTKSLATRFLSR
ncbi:MAG TPA: DUF4339 domain-containing protein [Pyrinomonadaceae bacterium]|jgi:hypothetical protein